MRVVVVNHLSLDGVLQAPGGADEDTRGGFRHGGWAAQAGADPTLGAAMGEHLGPDFSWLFGRRSYDQLLAHWNSVGGPFADGLNGSLKYVASSDPAADLPWPNSTLLTGDVPAAVDALRAQPGGNLVIMGSGHLIRTLLPHGLVDELFLMIHPLVLGSGQRLFGSDEDLRRWELAEVRSTDAGVLLASYHPRDYVEV